MSPLTVSPVSVRFSALHKQGLPTLLILVALVFLLSQSTPGADPASACRPDRPGRPVRCTFSVDGRRMMPAAMWDNRQFDEATLTLAVAV